MRFIFSNDFILKSLGKQKMREGVKYRLLYYCFFQKKSEGVLLYNLLTRSLLLLTHYEFIHIKELQVLKDQWFLVPEDFDDKKLLIQLQSFVKLMRKKVCAFSHFEVLTTTDCNARCFYCYEIGHSRIQMSEETALKVSDYIKANYQKLSYTSAPTQYNISLTWFGGEPLYNSAVIDRICTSLQTDGIPYRSTMVSNGYLFDSTMVSRAAQLWNLKTIQITIDGTREVYNRVKNYIHDCEDPYSRVMNNIALLLEHEIKVQIRLNIDRHNADNLKLLIEEFSDRFGGNKYLTIYSHMLFELSGPEQRTKSEEHRQWVFNKQLELQQLIENAGFAGKPRLRKDVRLNHCMADSEYSVLISPLGRLGLCEHYIDRDFFGSIDSDKQDTAVINSFKERFEDLPECPTCPYLPDCIRLKKCVDRSVCYPETKEWNIRNVKRAMLYEYELFLKKENNSQEEDHQVEEIIC